MCHYTNQFFLKRDFKFLGILTNTLHADEDIAIQNLAFAIVKRDDISIGVVVQILLIDAQQIVVATKNVVHIAYFSVFGLNHLANPKSIKCTLDETKWILEIECNHNDGFKTDDKNTKISMTIIQNR